MQIINMVLMFSKVGEVNVDSSNFVESSSRCFEHLKFERVTIANEDPNLKSLKLESRKVSI